jgi:hypothetical protein
MPGFGEIALLCTTIPPARSGEAGASRAGPGHPSQPASGRQNTDPSRKEGAEVAGMVHEGEDYAQLTEPWLAGLETSALYLPGVAEHVPGAL